MNNLKTLIILALLSGSISYVNAEQITYKSYIDPGYGFYKIRTATPSNISYNIVSKTLTINQGDTVIWINDADNIGTLSIVSDQNLWTGAMKLEKAYAFNTPGTYTFYIKEYPSVHQTIIVNSLDNYVITSTPIPTSTPAPSPTPVPPALTTSVPTTPISTISAPITNSQKINTTTTPTPSMTYSPPSVIATSTPKTYSYPSIDIKPTMIASIIVAIFSIVMTYRIGKNK